MSQSQKDIELMVLGLLLTSPDAAGRAQNLTSGGLSVLFASDARARLAALAVSHYARYGQLLDRDVVIHLVQSSPDRDAVLAAYDQACALKVGSGNFSYWLACLRERYLAGQLKNSMTVALDSLDEGRVEEAYRMLQDRLTYIEGATLDGDHYDSHSIRDTAQERWDRYIDTRENPEKYRGLMIGFDELDVETNGAHEGELYVWVSRTGVGKSVILGVVAHNLWLLGHSGFFAGPEMPFTQYGLRFDALHSRLRMRDIRDACLSEEDEEIYRDAVFGATYSENDIVYPSQKRCSTMPDIQAQFVLEERRRNLKFDFLVIDYLNIIKPTIAADPRRRESTTELQREVVEEARAMGILHGIPVFTAAQANRQGAESQVRNKQVDTEIIALSDFIGNTADMVAFLRRTQADLDENTITMVVIKLRNGAKKTIRLRCNLEQMYIGNLNDAGHTSLSLEGF